MGISDEARYRVNRPAVTLRGSVTESIRQMIATGHFEPGTRMPERELCELTGVSRTLVREALRQLESEGLIEVVPHKGPVVATITREQAIGVYQVREVLEGLAARLFALNADKADLGRLVDAFRKVKGSKSAVDRLEAKNAFYQALVRGARNEALGSTLYLLNSRTMLLRSRSIQRPGRWQESIAELNDIVEALKRRDAAAAEEMAKRHVRNAAGAAIQTFEPADD